MKFMSFRQEMQENFKRIQDSTNQLFEVEVDKDVMWNLYLDSFPQGSNDIYRERRSHDCSACRHFIKSIGNAVYIENNEVKTIWDFETANDDYRPVAKALDLFIKSQPITNIYMSKENSVGTNSNFEELTDGKIITWEHFYLKMPAKYVDKSVRSLGDLKGEKRDVRNVFKRSLDELTPSSVATVLELIYSNSLYKGEEWKTNLEKFKVLQTEYLSLSDSQKENFTWIKSVEVGSVIGKIRNHSIGTLLIDISKDVELDEAVRKYETVVAPTNYKRPKAIFTKKMLEEAEKKIIDLGLEGSLERRHAVLDDITVNNILFSNKDSAKQLKKTSPLAVFDEMSADVAIDPKKFSKVEEIDIKDFVKNVLPIAKQLEVFLENKHTPNMVSLIAPSNKDAKSMLKWNNNFGWAYSGNITDSGMKERVKNAGGKIDGVLRFSIQWNDESRDTSDLDAHCIEPSGNEIYYSNRRNEKTTGALDVDIINPTSEIAVENITWSIREKMGNGNYEFFVHVFGKRQGRDGFRAEIEFDGQVYAYNYSKEVMQGEKIKVAIVTKTNNSFAIDHKLTPSSSIKSRDVWNTKTNKFIPVTVAMYSPNYWDDQDKIGNKHYFFMLKDCINPEMPNGFFNEYLKEELMSEKRVFEALGAKMKVEPSDNQLSGVGFSSTKRDELIIKVTGQTERIMKVKF